MYAKVNWCWLEGLSLYILVYTLKIFQVLWLQRLQKSTATKDFLKNKIVHWLTFIH